MTTVFTPPATRHERVAIDGCPGVLKPNRLYFPYDPERRAACKPHRP